MSIFAMEQFIKIKKNHYYYYKRNYMLGVILSVLHILAAIFVVFLTLRLLYYMFKNIKKKDWRSVVFNVIIFSNRYPFLLSSFFCDV